MRWLQRLGERRQELDLLPAWQRLTYVCMRIGPRWWATVCQGGRAEAVEVMQALHDQGAEFVFAGEAASAGSAHWQLREALGVARVERGPQPWTAYPRSPGGDVNVQLLRTSFEEAVNRDGRLVQHFYESLFQECPELRRIFPRNMDGQVRMFGEKMAELMLHLEDPEYLKTHLCALGERHRRYGVQPAMFLPVAKVLIETLKRAAGGWGEQELELELEWKNLLLTAAELMGYSKEDVLAAAS